MDPHDALVAAIERVVRVRRTRRSYLYYGARPDPRWPLGAKHPHNTLRGFLLQTREWRRLEAALGRRPHHGETTRAIDAVLVMLALEDA